MESKLEDGRVIFDICNSGPGPLGMDDNMPIMKKNTPFENKWVTDKNKLKIPEKDIKKLMDMDNLIIHEWIVPKKHCIIFDPEDVTCEVLCQPIATTVKGFDDKEYSKNYIDGEILIYIKRKDTNKTDFVYIGSSLFSSPYNDNLSKYGYVRRYQKYQEANTGDIIVTALIASKEISTEHSFVDHRVTMRVDK